MENLRQKRGKNVLVQSAVRTKRIAEISKTETAINGILGQNAKR
jgi:hypothetical protein